MTNEEKERGFAALKSACETCAKCPLSAMKTNSVLGCGSHSAKLMFVGEAPGETEDETGIPFTGKAGKLLDLYLEAVGIERDEVYICNILKCRPPHNRDPLPEEEDACMDYLREQTRLIRPRLIVCLGRISAARLIHPDYKITREHGNWVKKGAFEMTAVYHPSALLRDPSKRAEMLIDMKTVKAKLDALSAGE